MQVNRKVLRDMLNDAGIFDESPIECIDRDGVVYNIIGIEREVHDDADGSVTVWFKIEEA